MATIDQLDISVYNAYAIRTRMIEEINQEFHIAEAGNVPAQAVFITTAPKMTEMDLLLGVSQSITPWAYFFPPKQFRSRRRAAFSFSRIVPSIKSTDDGGEEHENLYSVVCDDEEDEKERKAIAVCFKEISKLNNWLGFIVGRIGQFLQG